MAVKIHAQPAAVVTLARTLQAQQPVPPPRLSTRPPTVKSAEQAIDARATVKLHAPETTSRAMTRRLVTQPRKASSLQTAGSQPQLRAPLMLSP